MRCCSTGCLSAEQTVQLSTDRGQAEVGSARRDCDTATVVVGLTDYSVSVSRTDALCCSLSSGRPTASSRLGSGLRRQLGSALARSLSGEQSNIDQRRTPLIGAAADSLTQHLPPESRPAPATRALSYVRIHRPTCSGQVAATVAYVPCANQSQRYVTDAVTRH